LKQLGADRDINGKHCSGIVHGELNRAECGVLTIAGSPSSARQTSSGVDMAKDKTFSVITPAQAFTSGIERINVSGRGLLALLTPPLVIGAGMLFALAGQFTDGAVGPAGMGGARAAGWSCPVETVGATALPGDSCDLPAEPAVSVKDMIVAQLSCDACG
jgi:hypothetical protein